MVSKEQILKALSWKKDPSYCAKRLGITVSEFIKERNKIRNSTGFSKEVETAVYITALEDKIIEFSENLEDGTAKIKGIAVKEPRTAEEIQQVLKLDTKVWKLSSYWNKETKDQKGNTCWMVSAMVTKKKDSEISVEDLSAILGKVFEQKTFTKIENKKSASNKKALFIYTSDKHIAATVDNKVAVYKNDYDGVSFDARMKRVLYEVQYLTDTFGKFEDIFVIDLGDRMDGLNGYTTRGGHKLPQNMNTREAFETAIQVEKEFFDILFQSGSANNYTVINNANSNHGGEFDYMVSRALEIYINSVYPFVKTSTQIKFIDHITYGKHVVIFTHGKDDADMKHGLPMHLNDKTEGYINKYLMYHGIDHKEKTVSLVKGDLHVDNSQTCYSFRYRNVLSLFGGSKWISTNFGPTHPGCSFDIIEKDTDRIFEHKVLFK